MGVGTALPDRRLAARVGDRLQLRLEGRLDHPGARCCRRRRSCSRSRRCSTTRAVEALADLRARGYDLAIVEVSPVAFAEPGESEADKLAHRLWLLRREELRARYERLGVAVASWNERRSPRCGAGGGEGIPAPRATRARLAAAARRGARRRGHRRSGWRSPPTRTAPRAASATAASRRSLLLAGGLVLRLAARDPGCDRAPRRASTSRCSASRSTRSTRARRWSPAALFVVAELGVLVAGAARRRRRRGRAHICAGSRCWQRSLVGADRRRRRRCCSRSSSAVSAGAGSRSTCSASRRCGRRARAASTLAVRRASAEQASPV